MHEEWAVIDGFSNYIVSTHGRVMNRLTEKYVEPSHTVQGALKVGLFKGDRQYTRSLKVLVATAFLQKPTQDFDTPIQLDGDQDNIRVDNLTWRPRWFAWKYTRQFLDCEYWRQEALYLHLRSGVFYRSIYEVGVTYGVLFRDVRNHIWDGTPLFPDWEEFVLAK